MEERKDQLWKVQPDAEERMNEEAQKGSSPQGVDVGTSRIVAARKRGNGVETVAQLNAFIQVPYSRFTETILGQQNIPYYRDGEEIVVYGDATDKFANMFGAESRRPMAFGLLNAREKSAMQVLDVIVQNVVPKAKGQGDVLAFSVPAAPDGRESELTYHEATLRKYFDGLGYRAVAVNEGLAVVFSELEDNNFSGIGISCGGGMCNVALAFLSIPAIMYSLQKGGDSIDASVGAVVAESATRVKMAKEEGLDLGRPGKDKIEKALNIYYEDLVDSLVDSLRKSLAATDKLPRTDRPLPIVLSGGTAKAKGFKELFERTMKARPLPIEIAGVRLAKDPLTATARGALIAAMYEK
jgi:hypothetical protein